jgi:RimJ/RimL family protein N-acetyltransferase
MNIRLRALYDRDSDLLYRWINTRELVVLSAPFREVSRAAHDRWFHEIRSSDRVQIFAIARQQDDDMIGYCQLRNIDTVSRNAELQIRIGVPSMQGKGAGTLAVRALLRHAFDEMKLHRVQLQVFQGNIRAQRAYLKCGFRIEGTQREAVCIDGVFENVLMMGILSGEQR